MKNLGNFDIEALTLIIKITRLKYQEKFTQVYVGFRVYNDAITSEKEAKEKALKAARAIFTSNCSHFGISDQSKQLELFEFYKDIILG